MQAGTATSLHPDIHQLLKDLDANEAVALGMTERLSIADLNWRPNEGRAWSILQCLEHLTLTHAAYTKAMADSFARIKRNPPLRAGPVRPSLLGAQFLKKLEPPVRSGIRAPGAVVPPGNQSKDQVVAGFLETHADIRKMIGRVKDFDLNRLRFRNPLLPILRVRFGTGFLIMNAHERRHLWQANRVREELK